MKNYITNEILPDILHDLAEKFLENPEGICLHVHLSMCSDGLPELRVGVAQYGRSFNERVNLTEKLYKIIPKVSDGYDVIEDTVQSLI